MKRYVARIEMYIYAEDGEQAKSQVQALCKEQDDKEDNHCQLIALVEQPFGTLGNRAIFDVED